MSTTEALADIHKEITVTVPVEEAFETFTRGIGSWWPRGSHTIFENRLEEIVFESMPVGASTNARPTARRQIGPTCSSGSRRHGSCFARRVNPERAPTEVEVRFAPEGEGTHVELEHRGWEATGDPQGRAGYQKGWNYVLGRLPRAHPA